MVSRVDLHVHSKYSNRSAEWLFRRFNFPDSYSKPRELYERLKERRMDFVTITDHNHIDGCLEIADLPDTFISEEVTTYFPDDQCKIHLLVWGITVAQHAAISELRENIFELQPYLLQNGIAHAVAHPFYRVNDRLGASHIRRLAKIFRHFEGINGLRNELLSQTAQWVFARLPDNPELGPKFVLTAGSDDHGGIFPGSAWTETAQVTTWQEFLALVKKGKCVGRGKSGTPLVLSHSLYNTVYQFAKDKFSSQVSPHAAFLEKAVSRFMEGEDPTRFTLMEKINFIAQGVLSGKVFELARPGNASIWKEYSDYFTQQNLHETLARETAGVAEPERRAFLIANLFGNQLLYRFFLKLVRHLSSGNLAESVGSIAGMVPMALLLSPYWYAFRSHSPSRDWLRRMCRELGGAVPDFLHNRKRAWFTDTLEDVNGVANTIRRMTAAGVAKGADLLVITSRSEITITDIPIKNFEPIGEFELPEYELQKLSFPPILHMLDFIQREKFTELIISTPGPVGVTAMIAGKMLGLRTVGIYHTDFPQYIRILTDDSFLESLAWGYMHWFYTQFDVIFVNSEHYRQAWMERGIDSDKLKILPRGLDTTLFNPSHRDPAFWEKYGKRTDETGLLYVGRVSREKDLEIFMRACERLASSGAKIRPLIVGNGPFLEEMKRLLPNGCYTGYLAGYELARAYASADIFVFPSTTDTFGNVILEAQAAGLPCVVSDTGGPRELIHHGEDGFVTRSLDVTDFSAAIQRLIADPELRRQMGVNARARVGERDWTRAFEKFWGMSEE
ncbi:MAG TPA: glycosyltransferase [Chthoniobacterales bacterium]